MKQRLPAKRTTGWTSNLLAAAGDVLVPLLFAFGVGSIFSLICGCNPFTLYSYIIKKAFFSVGGLLNTLGYTTPIIITGMATAFPSVRICTIWALRVRYSWVPSLRLLRAI